jgi:uncharacterized protein DUF3168
MNAQSATIQALLSDTSITDLVSTRIEPVSAPQSGTLPDLIVRQVSNRDEILLHGPGKYPEARVRIWCRGKTVTEITTLGDAVIAFLDGHAGTYAGMAVKSFIKETLDEFDQEIDFGFHYRAIDFRVRYKTA